MPVNPTPYPSPNMNMSQLTPAEVRCHNGASNFSAAFLYEGQDCIAGRGDLVVFWLQNRVRLQKSSGDLGKDLVMLPWAAFPGWS